MRGGESLGVAEKATRDDVWWGAKIGFQSPPKPHRTSALGKIACLLKENISSPPVNKSLQFPIISFL